MNHIKNTKIREFNRTVCFFTIRLVPIFYCFIEIQILFLLLNFFFCLKNHLLQVVD